MRLFHTNLLEKLHHDLEDPDPEIRMKAAHELPNLGKKESIKHLITLLNDPDRRVRWRAAYSLGDFGEMGHETAFQALVSHLKIEQDWNVRRIIVMALRHWDERSIPPLMIALFDESDYVRRYAAMTLGFKRTAKAAPILRELAEKDPSKEVRDYSRWALEKIEGGK